MKKAFLLFSILFSCSMMSQTYVSLSYNVTSTDSIELGSYPAIELGHTFDKFSFGLCVGRGNLVFEPVEKIQNWFFEIRGQYNIPLENKFSAYMAAGLGAYLNTDQMITEFDLGISKSLKPIDIFAGLARFDNVNYFQIGVAKYLK